jgi:tetratricopeptide (TPR) repeat protein
MATDPPGPLPPPDHTLPAPTPRPDTRSLADADRTADAPGTADPTGSLPTIAGRYRLLEVIGRGGMGVVYAARDTLLDREVAVKTLLCPPDAVPLHRRRFLAEARISARLAHPGVPPVHDLGELPDGRPFIAMKLIRGRTLAELLDGRPGPGHDLPRFVAVFEHLCQAVGFAHSRGVVHRDLKPHNVMVGAFGEVQVMDWGLAKVLGDPGDEARDPAPDRDAAADTRHGAILGTLAYMAPEQARGETDRVDARSDAFGLGGILCAILTGRPPHTGDPGETLRRSAGGDLSEAATRLRDCGADPELIDLCRRCLAPDPGDRPADGRAAADAVAAYRDRVERRLRDAERDRVAAAARAQEERKRRALRSLLAAAAAVLLAGGGAVAWWQDRQATDRERERERAALERAAADERESFRADRARDGVRAGLRLAADLRARCRFADAAAALGQADEVLAGGSADDLRPAVAQARRDIEFARDLDAVRSRKSVWIAEEGGKGWFDTAGAPPAYRAAFLARGFDLPVGDPAELGDRVRSSALARELVAALDDWALDEPEAGLRARLLAVARRADPGRWTDRLRDPATRGDPDRLADLARDADVAAVAPPTLAGLAELMRRAKRDPSDLLTRAQAVHPDDFDLAFALGTWTERRDPKLAAGFYRAARVARPDHVAALVNLGYALHQSGDVGGAVRCYREAIELDPSYAQVHTNLGIALKARGDLDGAVRCFRDAVRVDPAFADAHANLGATLHAAGDLAGAESACRDALRHAPGHVIALVNLSAARYDRGDVAGAEVAARDAVRYGADRPMAHYNLGTVLWKRGDPRGAVPAFREAIRLDPADFRFHFNLGVVLNETDRPRDAAAAFREAVRVGRAAGRPARDLAQAHLGVGMSLASSRDLVGAEAAFREAARLDPDRADAHLELGNVLSDRGNLAGAAAAYREVIRLKPKDPRGHTNLGLALARAGEFDEAVGRLEEALRLDPTNDLVRRDLATARGAKAEREARTAPPPRAVGR